MSYAQIKPEYYRMFQPDSPWHAGAPGWKDAPWPGWGRNPNLVGPPRLAVEGIGSNCSACSARGVGDDSIVSPPATITTKPTPTEIALVGGVAALLIAFYFVERNH
jgi:hypothetical protein